MKTIKIKKPQKTNCRYNKDIKRSIQRDRKYRPKKPKFHTRNNVSPIQKERKDKDRKLQTNHTN